MKAPIAQLDIMMAQTVFIWTFHQLVDLFGVTVFTHIQFMDKHVVLEVGMEHTVLLEKLLGEHQHLYITIISIQLQNQDVTMEILMAQTA